jgi:hypothetical protein
MHRPHSEAREREGMPPASLPWVVSVGILGTAAELLKRPVGPDDLYLGVRTQHIDLHELLREAAVGFCGVPGRRYALADAAESLLANWLVEFGEAVAAPGEGVGHLVRRWAVEHTLPVVARELAAVASVERWRRLAEMLGRDGLDTLLRSDMARGVTLSGSALARLDCARWTAARGGQP